MEKRKILRSLKERPCQTFFEIIEFFKKGHRDEFLKLKINLDKIKDLPQVNNALTVAFNDLEESIEKNSDLQQKRTAQFLAWAYYISPKKVEKILQSYEENTEDSPFYRVSTISRYILQHEDTKQLSLDLV